MTYDPHDYRDLDARDRVDEHTPVCAREGCRFLAPLGPFCGLHAGQELAAQKGGARRDPRSPLRLLQGGDDA